MTNFRMTILPPRRIDRYRAMMEYLASRNGQFVLDNRSLDELLRFGFTRSRAEQTIEELGEAGKVNVRGTIIETAQRAELSSHMANHAAYVSH